MTLNLFFYFRFLIALQLLGLLTISLYVGASEPDNFDNSGIAAMNEGRYDDAYQYFSSQRSQQDRKNSALFYLAQISLAKEDADTAKTHIESSLEILPNNSEEHKLAGDIYCNLAQQSSIFSALKLAKKCIASYEMAIKKDAQNSKALMAATAFFNEAPGIAGGDKEKSAYYLALLEQVSPEHADTYKVGLYHREGKNEEALRLANSRVEKGIHQIENQYAIAMYYRDTKNLSPAKLLFESLAASQYSYDNRWYVIDSALQAGEVYLQEGKNIDKSIEYIERYKAMNNNPQDVHYFWSSWSLAKAYFATGNTEKFNTLVNQIKSEKYKNNKDFQRQFEKELKNHR